MNRDITQIALIHEVDGIKGFEVYRDNHGISRGFFECDFITRHKDEFWVYGCTTGTIRVNAAHVAFYEICDRKEPDEAS